MTHINLSTPTGWVCPCCHAVMAPHYPTCMYCKPQKGGQSVKDTPFPGDERKTGFSPVFRYPYGISSGQSLASPTDGFMLWNAASGALQRSKRGPAMNPLLGAPYGAAAQREWSAERMRVAFEECPPYSGETAQ